MQNKQPRELQRPVKALDKWLKIHIKSVRGRIKQALD